ncbi:hypothetical protein GJ496_001297 [Pomphorhynchus laevis]|nr:hypothetical protein GJ496_001297 [Pomphorhynchus laevis]
MSSIFAKIFGRNPKENPPNPQEAAERITEIIDVMQKRQTFLEGKIDDCIVKAKRYGTKNKRQAIAALKEKKRFEKRLEQTDGIITTLEYQREALQNAQSNADVLNVMGFAVKALKNVHKNVDPDKVYDIIDDITEQHEIAGEIANAISNPVGVVQNFDDDELLQELEDIVQEEIDIKLANVSPLPVNDSLHKLVDVPSKSANIVNNSSGRSKTNVSNKGSKAEAEESDLKHLEMWAS